MKGFGAIVTLTFVLTSSIAQATIFGPSAIKYLDVFSYISGRKSVERIAHMDLPGTHLNPKAAPRSVLATVAKRDGGVVYATILSKNSGSDKILEVSLIQAPTKKLPAEAMIFKLNKMGQEAMENVSKIEGATLSSNLDQANPLTTVVVVDDVGAKMEFLPNVEVLGNSLGHVFSVTIYKGASQEQFLEVLSAIKDAIK